MEFETIISKTCNEDVTQFWLAMDIWLNKPHVVNRRILTSSRILTFEFEGTDLEIFNWIDTVLSIESNSFSASSDKNISEILISSINLFKDSNKTNLNVTSLSNLENSKKYLSIAKQLPRNSKIFSPTLEVTIVEKYKNTITSFYKCLSNDKQSLGFKYPYRICYVDNKVTISVQTMKDQQHDSSLEWIKNQLLPRLMNWMVNSEIQNSIVNGSLNLVSAEKYAVLYDQLKKKYGTEIIKIWPENTDPLKFVYEDIAIATYLMLLWEKERMELGIEERQSFLDLGCGNGLLVHILASEGHKGLGIDLRRRKIWDIFPESTHLEVSFNWSDL